MHEGFCGRFVSAQLFPNCTVPYYRHVSVAMATSGNEEECGLQTKGAGILPLLQKESVEY